MHPQANPDRFDRASEIPWTEATGVQEVLAN